ncbi:MAG: universal stress protein [Saprospiraceae bacterium]|nr:universal stress protein [Saprospiraceae bacterium]
MMNNILVPVDFSETAANAVRYACQFAARLGRPTIKVVYVFMPQVDSEYPNFIPPMTEFSILRHQMLDEFIAGIETTMPAASVSIEKEVWVGFPADEIIKRSGEQNLIIMGTTGEGGILNKVFGSVSSAVAQRADCPVILVPSDAEFNPIHHILYASHYEAADQRMVAQLLEFNRTFQAQVHFVHIKGADSDRFDRDKEQIFTTLFAEGEPPFAFEIAELEADSVSEALNEYATQHHTELVVLVTRKRNVWEQLFHKSQTRNMARISRKPVMVLHLN